jgi:hypothetical protein
MSSLEGFLSICFCAGLCASLLFWCTDQPTTQPGPVHCCCVMCVWQCQSVALARHVFSFVVCDMHCRTLGQVLLLATQPTFF